MRAALLATSLVVCALPVAGQHLVPVGNEFQINTYTVNDQINPSAALTSSGEMVVVWSSTGSAGLDSSRTAVLGQRLAADGTPLGNEFEVNTYTTGYQILPAVTAGVGGEFVVVWTSDGSSGSDSSFYSVQAQRFAGDGTPLDGELQVNTYTTNQQSFPAVAANSEGEFVVVWHSIGSYDTDSDGRSIQGQRFTRSGAPLGGQFQVNALTVGDQADPALAMAADGSFVVVWMSTAGSDGSGRSIQGRRFSSEAVPVGDEFQANTYFTGHQYNPAVTTLPGGQFVVAWSSNGSSGTDSDYAVLAQRFGIFGQPIGDEMQVNSWTTAFQTMPAVAASPSGTFTVLWRSGNEIDTGPDGDLAGISRQSFAADGTPEGVEMVVNSYTTSYQAAPEIVSDDSGLLLAAWQSDGGTGTDRDLAIEAQRFDGTALFADGFESGDASAWSFASP